MSTTHQRISQAQDGVAQVQGVLDHAQTALAAAEQVEQAAAKSRKFLKFVLLLGIIGLVVAIVMRMRSKGDEAADADWVDTGTSVA